MAESSQEHNLKSLKLFDFSDFELDSFPKKADNLIELTLVNGKISKDLSERIAEISSLQQLTIIDCNVDENFVEIFTNFAKLENLKKMEVVDSEITSRGFLEIANKFQNSKIEKLAFANNVISDESKYFSEAIDSLKKMKSLSAISLSNNAISDAGAAKIAELINENLIIKNVLLAKNAISNDGAFSLLGAISEHPSFERLILDDNLIGDIPALSGLLMMNQNENLHLSFSDNFLTDFSGKFFLENFQNGHVKPLQALIQKNKFSHDLQEKINNIIHPHVIKIQNLLTEFNNIELTVTEDLKLKMPEFLRHFSLNYENVNLPDFKNVEAPMEEICANQKEIRLLQKPSGILEEMAFSDIWGEINDVVCEFL